MSDDDFLEEHEEVEEEEEDTSLNNPDAMEKYRLAATICNQALETVVKASVVGAKASELCELGDKVILDRTAGLYTKSKGEDKVEKGTAFPTSVSMNSLVSHFSPTNSDDRTLADGDLVRIDVGVHIDGYIAVAAHTILVQSEAAEITGKLADLFAAGQACIDVGVRSLKPGNSNEKITQLWEKVANDFEVNVCEGVLSHELKRFVIDGSKSIISKASDKNKVDEVEFETAQVWTLDVLLSTGPGKLREGDVRPCVFKRAPDQQYLLKTAAGRSTLSEISQRFQNFPFAVRQLNDRRSGRLGIADAMKHDLLVPYPVLVEKAGEFVVHFKCTVLITSSNISKATGLPIGQKFVATKKIVDADVKAACSSGLSLTGKKKKKKATKKKEGGEKKEGEAAAKEAPKAEEK